MRNSADRKLGGVDRALQALARSHPEIVALYLFGSVAKGKAGRLSDTDIAVLLDESQVEAKEFFESRLRLISEAMSACRSDQVDLVLLNEASPLLGYEVVRHGRLLYERDHDARVLFEARAVQHYLDLGPFYRVSRRYLKRQLLRRAEGHG